MNIRLSGATKDEPQRRPTWIYTPSQFNALSRKSTNSFPFVIAACEKQWKHLLKLHANAPTACYIGRRAPPRRQIHIAFTTPHTNNDMARRLNGKLPPHCRPHWPHKTLNICCISAGHTQPHKHTEWIHFRVASCHRGRARCIQLPYDKIRIHELASPFVTECIIFHLTTAFVLWRSRTTTVCLTTVNKHK